MNRKQLILILAVVALLGGAGLLVRRNNVASYKTTEGRMGQKILGEFDINSVAQVRVQHGSNEVNLAQIDDHWVVKERANYAANFTEVGDFLRKIWDLKVVQSVPVGASQLGRLELTTGAGASPAGTLIELKDKSGKTLKSIVFGKKHTKAAQAPSGFGGDEGWPDGRYVMVDGQAQSVSLVSESFSNIEPKPEQWLNKDFFKVEKVKSAAVTFANATNSWKLARETETGEMKLADVKPEEKVDSSKVSGIPNALSYPSFVDVATLSPADAGLDKGTTAVLETFEGFTYTLKVGNKSGDENYYVGLSVSADLPKERVAGKDEKKEDKEKLDKEFKDKAQRLADKLKQEKGYEKSVYVMAKWTVDALLKERSALMVEKKADATKPADPTKPDPSKEPDDAPAVTDLPLSLDPKPPAPGTVPPPIPPKPIPQADPAPAPKPADDKPKTP